MKNILVIDSGSTKADWAFISDSVTRYSTMGINPSRQTVFPELKITQPAIAEAISRADEIYFYGAGVFDNNTAQSIQKWIKRYAKEDAYIFAASDLLGAAISSAGTDSGIISILGTGSNTCSYDGKEIKEGIPTLGYIISDEGGGTQIGKSIIRSYFYNTMPGELRPQFEAKYDSDKLTIVEHLYQKEYPYTYLASFCEFLNECNHPAYRKEILYPVMKEFIEIRIKTFEDYSSRPLHFIGSIAYFCRDILEEVLSEDNLSIHKVVRKPILGLIDYYSNKR